MYHIDIFHSNSGEPGEPALPGVKGNHSEKNTHKKRVIKFEFCIKDIPQPDAKDISGPYVLSFI